MRKFEMFDTSVNVASPTHTSPSSSTPDGFKGKPDRTSCSAASTADAGRVRLGGACRPPLRGTNP
jgi:hypothetical protein